MEKIFRNLIIFTLFLDFAIFFSRFLIFHIIS
jgi:hypothetical protein